MHFAASAPVTVRPGLLPSMPDGAAEGMAALIHHKRTPSGPHCLIARLPVSMASPGMNHCLDIQGLCHILHGIPTQLRAAANAGIQSEPAQVRVYSKKAEKRLTSLSFTSSALSRAARCAASKKLVEGSRLDMLAPGY